MSWVVVLPLVALVSAACGTAARWERSGASPAELRRDETECASLAGRERSMPAQRVASSRPDTRHNETLEAVPGRDFDAAVFDGCMKARCYARVSPRPPG